MGWKGAVRSIGAAVRAAEKDAKRRRRELEKRQKQYEKMLEIEQAAYEVEVYENHIDLIQSVHKECSNPVNWEAIATSQEPKKPLNKKVNEQSARMDAESYKPGFTDKILKRAGKKRIILEEKIKRAIEKDDAEHKTKLVDWEKKLNQWQKRVTLAKSILGGDVNAKIAAIKYLDPFSEISALGSVVTLSAAASDFLEATIHVHGNEIVPGDVKSLLKSGKLSLKKMPKGKFNEIYQDYVCSCVLRVANELFSAIPDKIVVVTAVDELLNSKTGHLEKSPILSACISRSTLQALNMGALDPSDSMDNFIHNMSFKKTKGFEAVPRVDPRLLENG